MRTTIGAILTAMAALTAAAACGSSPPPVTIHGTVTPSGTISQTFGQGLNADGYGACSETSPAPGTQVTVTSPSGTVIGTGTLGSWNTDSVVIEGTTMYHCDMPFTIKNVPQETRYGLAVSGVPGTIWETSVSGAVSLEAGGS